MNLSGRYKVCALKERPLTFAPQIDIVDMWKEHTPWPFNKLPDSYAFLVRHSILWRISYQMTQVRAHKGRVALDHSHGIQVEATSIIKGRAGTKTARHT